MSRAVEEINRRMLRARGAKTPETRERRTTEAVDTLQRAESSV